jgi:thermostable 8-oxoguanine DNA glycosylase
MGQAFSEMSGQTTKLLKIQGMKRQNEEAKNLSTTFKKKFTMKHTKSIAQARSEFKNLQQTLQEAGKLPPTRPQLTDYEKMVMLER